MHFWAFDNVKNSILNNFSNWKKSCQKKITIWLAAIGIREGLERKERKLFGAEEKIIISGGDQALHGKFHIFNFCLEPSLWKKCHLCVEQLSRFLWKNLNLTRLSNCCCHKTVQCQESIIYKIASSIVQCKLNTNHIHLGNELSYSFITLTLIANSWQHCFERQGVGLIRSIAIRDKSYRIYQIVLKNNIFSWLVKTIDEYEKHSLRCAQCKTDVECSTRGTYWKCDTEQEIWQR